MSNTFHFNYHIADIICSIHANDQNLSVVFANDIHLDLYPTGPVVKTGPDVTRCIYFNFGFFGIIMNDQQSV